MLRWITNKLPTQSDDRGSTLGAMMFAVIIAAVLATAALASIQVTRSTSAVQHSGLALLAVGDRVQIALDNVNTTRTGAAVARIDTAKKCDQSGVCTEISQATLQSNGQISLVVRGTTPDGASATRQAVLRQLPTSGVVTNVDADGRLEFVQDGGTGTDLWQIVNTWQNEETP